MQVTVEGWRFTLTGGWIAIDNRPAVDEAKVRGKSEPELQHVALGMEILTSGLRRVVKSAKDGASSSNERTGSPQHT